MVIPHDWFKITGWVLSNQHTNHQRAGVTWRCDVALVCLYYECVRVNILNMHFQVINLLVTIGMTVNQSPFQNEPQNTLSHPSGSEETWSLET